MGLTLHKTWQNTQGGYVCLIVIVIIALQFYFFLFGKSKKINTYSKGIKQNMSRVKDLPTYLFLFVCLFVFLCLSIFLTIALHRLWLNRVGSFKGGINLNISPLAFSFWYSKVGLSSVSLLCHQSKHTVKDHDASSRGKTR